MLLTNAAYPKSCSTTSLWCATSWWTFWRGYAGPILKRRYEKKASLVPYLPIWVGARSCWTNVVGKLDYTIKSKVSFYLNFKPDICYNPSVIWFIHFTWTNCKQIFFSRHQAFKHCYRWKLGLTQNCIGKWKNSFTNFECEWFFKPPPHCAVNIQIFSYRLAKP